MTDDAVQHCDLRRARLAGTAAGVLVTVALSTTVAMPAGVALVGA